jgi:hypothetical protein
VVRYEVEPTHDGKAARVMRREETGPGCSVRVEVARYPHGDTAQWIAAELNGFAHLEVSQ